MCYFFKHFETVSCTMRAILTMLDTLAWTMFILIHKYKLFLQQHFAIDCPISCFKLNTDMSRTDRKFTTDFVNPTLNLQFVFKHHHEHSWILCCTTQVTSFHGNNAAGSSPVSDKLYCWIWNAQNNYYFVLFFPQCNCSFPWCTTAISN